MRRAVTLSVLAALLVLSAPGFADEPVKVSEINGIGLMDYSRAPTFKVGDWVRYHLSSHSEMGMSDDYTVTVLVAGEEYWWGEDCFWLETWTEFPHRPAKAIATLMSYDIFKDPEALPNFQLYMRKTIQGLDEKGNPIQELFKRPQASIQTRTTMAQNIKWSVDTLGDERVVVPKGTYDCKKVVIQQGTGATGSTADSSMYSEVREKRTSFYTHAVPMTSIAEEIIDYSIQRKTWKIGHSSEATPMLTIERSLGTAKLVDFGHGKSARLLPPSMRITLAQSKARQAKQAAASGGRSG